LPLVLALAGTPVAFPKDPGDVAFDSFAMTALAIPKMWKSFANVHVPKSATNEKIS